MRRAYLLMVLAMTALVVSCAPKATPTAVRPTPQVRISIPTNRPGMPTPAPMRGCSTINSLRIRSEPNKDARLVGGLAYGQCVNIFGTNEDRTWIAIGNDPVSGWVLREYLSIDGDIEQLPVSGEYVTRSEVIVLPTGTEYSFPTMTPIRPTNTPPASPVSSVLMCADTVKHVDEQVTCRLEQAHCTYQPGAVGSPTVCSDAPYPDTQFTLIVREMDWSAYDGKCLMIEGAVRMYSGKPRIEAWSRSQVSYCP